MTATDIAKATGKRMLFCGADTGGWSIAQFQTAARFARAHGIDSLLIKVGEGTWTWYNGLAGWENIRKAILAEGCGAIPYFYSKGNTLGGLAGEIALYKQYMQADGVLCIDMEVEWNGDVSSAQTLAAALRPVPGMLLISTWADPSLQSWAAVIRALAPAVDAFMPQQYNDYLAGFWQEFAADGASYLIPTVILDQSFGTNHPVTIAQNAHNEGHPAISVWYYDLAIAQPGLVDQIVAAYPEGATITPAPPSQGGTTTVSGIPNGWRDDGKTLKAPNGIEITQGFRDYILAHDWPAGNIPLQGAQGLSPLELSNPALGGGTRQVFRWTVLEWTSKRGVFESWVGQELLTTLNILHQTQGDLQELRVDWNKVVPEKDGLVAQVAQLTKDLEAKGNVEQLQQELTAAQQKLAQINELSK